MPKEDVFHKAYKALSRRCEKVVKKREMSVTGFRIVHKNLVLECKMHESNDIAIVYVLYKRKNDDYYQLMNFSKHASRALSCREAVRMLMKTLSRDDVDAIALDSIGSLDDNWFMYKHDTLESLAIECDMSADASI